MEILTVESGPGPKEREQLSGWAVWHPRHVFWAIGFRPFFFGIALLGIIYIPLWLLLFYGKLELNLPITGRSWHWNQMFFGFGGGLVAAFLLTAAQNWTGEITARRQWLMALFFSWLAARILLNFSLLGAAVFDILFFVSLAFAISLPIIKTKNRRNYLVVAAIWGLALANILYYLKSFDKVNIGKNTIFWLLIDLFSLKIALVGGRIIPIFTANALRRKGIEHRVVPMRELGWIVLGLIIAILALEFTEFSAVQGWLSLAVAVLLVVRMVRWETRLTFGDPLLLILHVANVWFILSWVFRWLGSVFAAVPPSAVIHFFTAGSIGIFAIAMMTRVATGHTGRPLVAKFPTPIAYLLMNLAAGLRIANAFQRPDAEAFLWTLIASATCWSAAMLLYAIQFSPILFTPRPDGKPG